MNNMKLQSINSFNSQPMNDRKIKPISSLQLKSFGLSRDSVKKVDTLEELKKQPLNIVVADCKQNVGFMQNFFKQQHLKKKAKYVMGLGIFQQLHFDMERNVKVLEPSRIKFNNIYKPYIGQDLSNKTLLVSRTGGIGDLLFIQPNLRHLKEKYPNCIIKFACGPQYRAMVESWDCLDIILDLPFTIQHLVTADYHAFFEGVIERCREAETKNAYNLFSRWLGLDLPDEKLLPIQVPVSKKIEESFEILDKFSLKSKDFIMMQLRASSPIRCPSPELWIKLIDKLTDRGYNILITDNPLQAEAIDKYLSLVKNKDKVFNYCTYSKTLADTIAMTSLSNAVISTDSALLHLAASLQIPLYGLYGPFPGKIRLSTYPKAKWIEGTWDCCPCFVHGMKPCKQAKERNLNYSPCYDSINLDKIVEDVEGLMND